MTYLIFFKCYAIYRQLKYLMLFVSAFVKYI